MKYSLFFFLAGLCVVSACKKNSLPSAGGNMLSKTVVTLSANAYYQETDSFVYDGQQRLVQIISSFIHPSAADTISFQYDASGRVTSWTQGSSGVGRLVRYDLSYDGNGRVVKELAVPLLSNYEFSDYFFAYNTEGQVIADTVYAQHLADSISPGITNYDVFTYDKTGNLVTDQWFGSTNSNYIGPPFKAGGTNTFQYDTHVNPYYHMGLPLFASFAIGYQVLSPNNIVVFTSSDPNAISPSRYSFAYYSNDRPRQQTTTVYPTSGAETQTTAYFYQ